MNIVKLIFPILTLPYLTRVLTIDLYGTITFLKSVLTYVALVIDFGFLLSSTKKIVLAGQNNEKINKIISDTLYSKIILGFFSSIFYLVLLMYLPIMRVNISFSILFLAAYLLNIFIFDFLFRGIEKIHLVAIPYIISKSISTFLTFIFVKSDLDLFNIALLEFLGNFFAVFFSVYFVYKLNYKIIKTSIEDVMCEIKESFVYFISNFANSLLNAVTILLVGILLTPDKVAIWGICIQLLNAAKSMYNPLVNSIYPYMIRTKNLKLIKLISLIVCVPMVLGTIVVIYYGSSIMVLLGGENYSKGGEILVILLPAFIFSFYSMIFGWPVFGAIGKINETSSTTIIVGVVQIVIIGFLIMFNNFNLITLAIACSCSEMLLFIIRYILLKKYRSLFI
ncbi:TPA: oligosaccharide flippase family protein [Streptococcus suis]|uniref:Wzx n=1 Tax=Streptococcus suis TaxID=1307 RepID=A0A1P8VRC4_STRSU|nr:Wzx [Streptococcus suis]APZ79267.1 Wzx [Streptococcus suis]HEM2786811.1 oligosaccharide flippase family protein [Streptococcus suis]